jgi:hypothetical protein
MWCGIVTLIGRQNQEDNFDFLLVFKGEIKPEERVFRLERATPHEWGKGSGVGGDSIA